MSKYQAPKKTTSSVTPTNMPPAPTRSTVTPTTATTTAAAVERIALPKEPLIFGKTNYIWMGAGAGLIALGMILMAGGAMPSPDVWDESLIYSPMRITVAPICIIAGLIVEVFAIFKKN
jgi:Protein of unknown function (DUF3098)